MVLSVIAQDTPRKLTDDDHRILASIFGWATIPDLSGTHLEEPSPGNFVLYDELHQVLARLGPGTQASTSSTVVETPFDDDVPADNALLSEQDVGATLFPLGEEGQLNPLVDDPSAEMEVDAPSPKAPVARTGFSFFPALFSREKPSTESTVIDRPVVAEKDPTPEEVEEPATTLEEEEDPAAHDNEEVTGGASENLPRQDTPEEQEEPSRASSPVGGPSSSPLAHRRSSGVLSASAKKLQGDYQKKIRQQARKRQEAAAAQAAAQAAGGSSLDDDSGKSKRKKGKGKAVKGQ
ncbi:hypothetical protein V5O48_019185 [Marasmius crinis-equi]|uniref:Uncharacterized protein n=1 Tax=Marasmius crinis-equi TaxID=585013 RepID=A0ABR3EJ60_9AGAR